MNREEHFFYFLMGSGTGIERRRGAAAAALGALERPSPGMGSAEGLKGGGVVVLIRGSLGARALLVEGDAVGAVVAREGAGAV